MFAKSIIVLRNIEARLRIFSLAIFGAINAAKEFNSQTEKFSHLIEEEDEEEKH